MVTWFTHVYATFQKVTKVIVGGWYILHIMQQTTRQRIPSSAMPRVTNLYLQLTGRFIVKFKDSQLRVITLILICCTQMATYMCSGARVKRKDVKIMAL